MVIFRQLSSLEKVMVTNYKLPETEFIKTKALKNETFSYQIAYVNDSTEEKKQGAHYIHNVEYTVAVNSSLEKYITLRKVEHIPSIFPAYPPRPDDDDYITTESGLYPDMLNDMPVPRVFAVMDKYFSLWITVKLDGKVKAGTYPIDIIFEDNEGGQVKKSMEVEVIDEVLPDLRVLHTRWIHTDCVATFYQTKIFSEKHWNLMDKYIEAAANAGVNMLFTPVFTPPIDTKIGGERPTVQLVDIEKTENGYVFDFKKLKRWIALGKKHGFKNYEIGHLFSQGGAKYTPKIVAKVNGRPKKIFGWHTEGACDAYKTFLAAFLPELVKVLKEEKVDKGTWFHISDEPSLEHLEHYQKVKRFVEPYIKGFKIFDALSDIVFYKTGAVPYPVVNTQHINGFVKEKLPGIWAYYCCGTGKGLSNDYFSMPSRRTRAIGLQLYKFDIMGFLHWGFNFYYSSDSVERLNPYLITDAQANWPSGDCFSVYPGKDGPLESVRLRVFFDAMQDIQALQLLESYIGKQETVKFAENILEEEITFDQCVRSDEAFFKLRNAIYEKVEALNKGRR